MLEVFRLRKLRFNAGVGFRFKRENMVEVWSKIESSIYVHTTVAFTSDFSAVQDISNAKLLVS
jgi:hypothetical protein